MPIIETMAYVGKCDSCDIELRDSEGHDLYYNVESILEEASDSCWVCSEDNKCLYCYRCRANIDDNVAKVYLSDRIKCVLNRLLIPDTTVRNKNIFRQKYDGFIVKILEVSEDYSNIKIEILSNNKKFNYEVGSILDLFLLCVDRRYDAIYALGDKYEGVDKYKEIGFYMHVGEILDIYFDDYF